MKRIKIAILIAFPADPLRPCGGVEAVAVGLVRGLAQIPELDVHVVTWTGSGTPRANWEGATFHYLPPASSPLLKYATGRGRDDVFSMLRELQPDVVHAHDTFGIMDRGFPCPRVFTIHGFIHEDTLYSGQKMAWLRAKLWKRAETAAWADQPHLISISPYVREYLQSFQHGTVHDIENPIGTEFFSIPRQEEVGTIFCAAAIGKRKNTLGLVKAFALLAKNSPEAKLRWAGPVTDEAYHQEVLRCIAQNGLGSRITLLGSINSTQIRKELGKASVFGLVSFEEGAPMGIAEAMAAGLPVLTSNRCGMPYMVRHGETGFLVNPDDPSDMANRLTELLTDAGLRERMSQQARRVAQETYHPDRVAEKTFRVYRQAFQEYGKVKR